MNEQLKQAITTIAEYMGCDGGVSFNGEHAIGHLEHISTWIVSLKYHTSADALLEVWRKVRKEMQMWRVRHVLYAVIITDYIVDGNYPAACIELAEIIKQLKEK